MMPLVVPRLYVRAADAGLVASSDAKVTDPTTQTTPELQKSLTITAPGPRQYLRLRTLSMDIAGDVVGSVNGSPSALTCSRASWQVVGYHSLQVAGSSEEADVLDGVATISAYGYDFDAEKCVENSPDTLRCTNNNWTTLTRTLNRNLPRGKGVTARFKLAKFVGSTFLEVSSSYCIRNARLTYDIVSKATLGGVMP